MRRRGFSSLLSRSQCLSIQTTQELYTAQAIKRGVDAGGYGPLVNYNLTRNARARFGFRALTHALARKPVLAVRRAFSATKFFLRARRRLFNGRAVRSQSVGLRTELFVSRQAAQLGVPLGHDNEQEALIDSQNLYPLYPVAVRQSTSRR